MQLDYALDHFIYKKDITKTQIKNLQFLHPFDVTQHKMSFWALTTF